MRLEFITQNDPLYILPFFEEFFRHYRNDFAIERVLVSRPMGGRSRRRLLLDLLMLYRPLGFLRLCYQLGLSRLLSTLPRTAKAARFFSLRQLCKAYGIPYEEIGNPNARDIVDQMRSRRPDALASVACPYILKGDLLSIPALGCINIHHAPLPRYKGMMPTFWQMLNGETQVGLTVHYMATNVDEGTALLQDSMQIEHRETLDHLIRRSKRHGAHCMAKVLRHLSEGEHTALQLDHSNATYFTFPKPEEIRRFHRKGLRAI